MELVRVDWDGTERWRMTLDHGHSDFDLVDDETFLTFRGETREIEGPSGLERVMGDTVVEVDLDGNTRELWSAWTELELDFEDTTLRAPNGDIDWTHANYVRYDAATDAVQITLRSLATAFELDRSTGEVQWEVATEGGDYASTGGEALLDHPHSVWPIDQGLLVFNQRRAEQGECAEAVVIRLDDLAATATRTWTYETESCRVVGYVGNAQPLDGDRTLVSFAEAGLVDEVDASSGQLYWRLQTPPMATLEYVERFAGFGSNQP